MSKRAPKQLEFDGADLCFGHAKIAELFDGSGNAYCKSDALALTWGAKIVRCVNHHDELVAALEQIAEGCVSRRPGHVDADKNLTKAEIEAIARAILAKVKGE